MRDTSIAVGGLVLLAIVISGGVTYFMYNRAVHARMEAQRAMVVAQEARERAAATTEFLTTVIAPAEPRADAESAGHLEVLDRASHELGHITDDPTVEAALRFTIARSYLEAGAHERALVQLLSAYQMRKDALGSEHAKTQEVVRAIVDCYEALGDERQARVWRRQLP